jgi:hypothetical protein
MAKDRSDRLSLKRALGISSGLHLLLLPLFVSALPAFFGTGVASSDHALTDREATTISYLTIERRPAPRPKPVAAPVQPAKATPRVALVVVTPPRLNKSKPPVNKAVPAARHVAAALAVVGRAARAVRDAVRTVAFAAVRTLGRNASAPAGAAVPETVQAAPLPSPSATPVATLAEASSARGIEVPAGGWGQNFESPIVADDTTLADLRARYHVVASVSIEVDDSGHATRVTLPSGVPDDVRADLERRLMELRYVPAECNGLRCPGTLALSF